MAKGTRELKARIRGVKNIKQITRAMEMVAATKLVRLQVRAEGASPYARKLRSLVGTLAARVDSSSSPLFDVRPVERAAMIVVSSDRGLCGAYNSNVFREARSIIERDPSVSWDLHIFGVKGAVLLRSFGSEKRTLFEAPEHIEFRTVTKTVSAVRNAFVNGDVDEVQVVYTKFNSAANQRVTSTKLLPIDPANIIDDEASVGGDTILEPSAEDVFTSLLPKYLEVGLFSALLDSAASEFAMRRMAMKAATDAANDMIGELTRLYNRARQEAITTELLDIVGGAEALA